MLRPSSTYRAVSKHCCQSVGREHLGAHGERVRDLKQRSDGEGLCDVGLEASEGMVSEQDILVNFLRDVFDGAGVLES
jgi:hypothetical protein